MFKLIVKQFIQHWKIWISILPIFIVSGLVFSTSLIILNAINIAGTSGEVDYGVFMQTPIIIGGVVLCLLTRNAMKQCIDLFDDTNDILLLLGSSPLQISVVMTGQMLVIGIIGAAAGILFSVKAAQAFLTILPSSSAKESLAHLPLQLSWNVVYVVILVQIALILFTCIRYCLKNFKKRKGNLSSSSHLNKRKLNGVFIGIVAILVTIGATLFLFFKEVPDPSLVKDYNSSMNSSMSLLLLIWISLIIVMNFLIRPIFKGIVNVIVGLPSITKHPMTRSAFFNMQYDEEGFIKLSRPVCVITLLIGNFIALFLNTKLLVDGRNDGAYVYDLIISLVFVFGAPIVISLANIITSIFLFRIETKAESKHYYFSGCTPMWIFKLQLIEIGMVSLISILITLFGTFLFAIPLLRVAYLGGGDIFKANWTVNILLTCGAFFLFFLFFILINWLELYSKKTYLEQF